MRDGPDEIALDAVQFFKVGYVLHRDGLPHAVDRRDLGVEHTTAVQFELDMIRASVGLADGA